MRVLVLENDTGEARRIRKAFEAEQFAVDAPSPKTDSLELAIGTQYTGPSRAALFSLGVRN